jgi:hypothetical protein
MKDMSASGVMRVHQLGDLKEKAEEFKEKL